MPDIGQQGPRKWLIEEGETGAGGRTARRPPQRPSGRSAPKRGVVFAFVLLAVAAAAVALAVQGGVGEGGSAGGASATSGLDPRDAGGVVKLVMAGEKLSEAQVAALEQRLSDSPADLNARTQLVAFYGALDHKQSRAGRLHAEHVVWLVDHEPTAPILGMLNAQLRFPDAHYKEARDKLLAALQGDDKNLVLLRNAGSFLALHDPEVADKLFARGQALDPGNSEWSQWRGELASNLPSREPATTAEAQVVDAEVAVLNKALAGLDGKAVEVPPGHPPFSQLGDLAMTAWSKGEYPKAQRYAVSALNKAAGHKGSWAYGEVVHLANVVIGHLALQVGRVDLAEKYLLRAAAIPGSPRLSAGGPDLTLAKALVAKGRRDAVSAYFERCKGWWKLGTEKGTLSRWMKQLAVGTDPDYTVP